MILINLLPHREATRKRRREAFQMTMFGSFVLGLLISGVIYWFYQMMIADQQQQNALLTREIQALEEQIKEIASIEKEIASLQARQKAVENLQADRNLPVHLLTQLVKQMPDGSYATSLKQTGQSVSINGVAQSNERVAEVLRNLTDNTAWFSKPQLVEITTGNVNLTPRDQRKVSAFDLNFQLMRVSEVQKAGDAAAPKSGN